MPIKGLGTRLQSLQWDAKNATQSIEILVTPLVTANSLSATYALLHGSKAMDIWSVRARRVFVLFRTGVALRSSILFAIKHAGRRRGSLLLLIAKGERVRLLL